MRDMQATELCMFKIIITIIVQINIFYCFCRLRLGSFVLHLKDFLSHLIRGQIQILNI